MDVGSARGSVRGSAEPERARKTNLEMRNKVRLATETGGLRGDTSTLLPELNLKI